MTTTDFIRARVLAVGQGSEALGALDNFAGPMARRQAQTLTMRVETAEGQNLTVALRGTSFNGGVPRNGDQIAIPPVWRDGRLEPPYIVNETTGGERVQAVMPPAAMRWGYIALVVVVALFIIACFAWVGYGFFTMQ